MNYKVLIQASIVSLLGWFIFYMLFIFIFGWFDWWLDFIKNDKADIYLTSGSYFLCLLVTYFGIKFEEE